MMIDGNRRGAAAGLCRRPAAPLHLAATRSRTPFLVACVSAAAALLVIAMASQSEAADSSKPAPEIVVRVNDLPKSALSEFAFWKDPASPGGRMLGIPNSGDELDPPPENDPHVTFKVAVQRGIPYRCWIHMKVGKPKGKSQANVVFVQFTGALDKSGKEIFKPGTASYLTARGPAREGWTWVGRDLADRESAEPLIFFKAGGEISVRVQAGMEGVGFDQVLLSPARFLEKAPTDAVVK